MNEERIKIGDGIRFRYTNYKGKKCVRYAIVKRIYTGSNEWHKVMTTSLTVAEEFGKQHKNVLQSIENLECSEEFGRLNFQPSSYINEQNKKQPMYEMTKDGWMFLVMGFTGKKAAYIKEVFIAMFNEMERMIREDRVNDKQDELEAMKEVEKRVTALKRTFNLSKVEQRNLAKRLYIEKGLKIPTISTQDPQNDKENIKTNVDSVKDFFNELIENDIDRDILTKQLHKKDEKFYIVGYRLFEMYKTYCYNNMIKPLGRNTFFHNFNEEYSLFFDDNCYTGKKIIWINDTAQNVMDLTAFVKHFEK